MYAPNLACLKHTDCPALLQNHMVWARGEPAFVKVWQRAPATLKSEAALQAEQGSSQVLNYLAK